MDKDIKQIQQEFEKKEEQERAMKNVTCPKLANTLESCSRFTTSSMRNMTVHTI